MMIPDSERMTGSYSFNSSHPRRSIGAVEAEKLYGKLKRFLRVIPSWGNYLPIERGIGFIHDISKWPLAYRLVAFKNILPPVCVVWAPWRNTGVSPPTFEQFLCAYGLTIELPDQVLGDGSEPEVCSPKE